ncbi:3-oxoadipate enol-lactonase [Haladaptatus sp. R4]|uniref:alpha/beta fold hydrolase n=1 Tax=Haladaptatus sp. R4 TaxID=1679489 RepID=UPI0007B4CE86|nr:alpha/beta hydrolase [Haladaptatus sp. R4]KZN25256.1 3-oxoadipate enol-lactonase [Haladaptatus sp. R4]
MPFAEHDGTSIYYETDGSSKHDTVAFVGDAAYGAWQWGWQHAAVTGPFESLVWDHRGTGKSDAPDGPYSVAEMAGDLDAVLADHGVRKAHLVGAGLGGMVALHYAKQFSRAKTLTLIGTAADGSSLAPDVRDRLLAEKTPDALHESLRPAVSEEAFAAGLEDVVEWRLADDASLPAQRAQFAALEAFDVSDELYEITTPAIVCHGTDDRVIPVEAGKELADGLPRGELVTFEDAPHLVHVEHSKAVNDALLDFLARHVDETFD